MNQFNFETLLKALRDATADAHASLDASFGSLDIADRDDYVRFLRAHAIGLAPMFADYRAYIETTLGLSCPDFPAMLRADLAELGEETADLPRVEATGAVGGAGLGYVVTGSRLGLAAISRNGYWGRANGLPSQYMEDQTGLVLWKDLAARLKTEPAAADARTSVASALAAFATFERAFAASARANQG
ncbi:hypothetical protein B2G71_06120 [Novosphingobium sp. PC22D]|nr:hypothetical protein B2G71_06120 [Novosphingobium sp. PC22D]